MVASLISGRSTVCAQPASRMTRRRRSPLVAAVPGPANVALGKTSPRITYNAARIFAMAASVAASDVGAKSRVTRLLPSQYEDTSVGLVRRAMELEAPDKRAAFWRQLGFPNLVLARKARWKNHVRKADRANDLELDTPFKLDKRPRGY